MTATSASTSAIGIGAIAGYVPAASIDVMGASADFDVSPSFIESKTGFRRLSRMALGEDCVSLAVEAASRLSDIDPLAISRCGLLIVVTQNPDGYGLPHASALVAAELGLPSRVAAFDISLGCSGWVYAVATATAFMEMHGIDDGLVITSDPYSKIIDPRDRDTAMLFGDASAATLLTRRNPDWRAGKYVFGTDGSRAGALQVDDTRKLQMKGRDVFTFSAVSVPPLIAEVLRRNDLTWDDVDRVVLHQGSRYIVDTIGQRIGQPRKTPFVAQDYGNTVSSSIPLVLASSLCRGDGCIVVAGFGVGLSYAGTAFFRTGENGH